MPKFPEHLRVGAHDFTVVVAPKGTLEGDRCAELDYMSNTIRVSASVPWTRTLEFLCHELLHSIYSEMAEGAVAYGGEACAAILRHNPDLLRWVLACIKSE